MLRPQRQDDPIVLGRGLQLEIEERQNRFRIAWPQARVSGHAERRVDDHLHSAALIEEPLEDNPFVRGQ